MKKLILLIGIIISSCGHYDVVEISPADWRYKRVNYKQIYNNGNTRYNIIFTYSGEYCLGSDAKYNWAQKDYYIFCDYWYDKPLSLLTDGEHITE